MLTQLVQYWIISHRQIGVKEFKYGIIRDPLLTGQVASILRTTTQVNGKVRNSTPAT